MALTGPEEPTRAPASRVRAVLALGVPIWTLQYAGLLPAANPLWHAHEMLFGYAFAVITGFLLTAVRNWTAQPTPSGAPLAGIAALWIVARLVDRTPS